MSDFNILALITAALRPYDFPRSAPPDAPVLPDRAPLKDAVHRWLCAACRIVDKVTVRRGSRHQSAGSPRVPATHHP